MATAGQIAANRRNALKSTGPRTAAGKAVSSRNALRHGLTARAPAVFAEDLRDFDRFRAEWRSSLAPCDAREELLADAVVEAAWRRRCAVRAETALFNRAGRLDLSSSEFHELATIRRYEIAADRAHYRALALLDRWREPRRPGGMLKGIDFSEGTRCTDAARAPKPFATLAFATRTARFSFSKGCSIDSR